MYAELDGINLQLNTGANTKLDIIEYSDKHSIANRYIIGPIITIILLASIMFVPFIHSETGTVGLIIMLIITGVVAVPTIIIIVAMNNYNKRVRKNNNSTPNLVYHGYIQDNVMILHSYTGDTIQINLDDLLSRSHIYNYKNNTGYFIDKDITQIVNYQTKLIVNNQIVYGAVVIRHSGYALTKLLNKLGYNIPNIRKPVYDGDD